MEDPNDQNEHHSVVEGGPFEYRTQAAEPVAGSPLARLSAQLLLPDEQIDLAEAALTIATMEYPGLQESYYLDRLDQLADEVRPLISAETEPLKNIENLNYFLNSVKGFHGNETDYNDRRNSYLNDVLERKTGLPITLSLLYIELGKRLGLHFEGIGLPGHFIIRYRELEPQLSGRNDNSSGSENLGLQEHPANFSSASAPSILLDPFNGGTILTEEECITLVFERYGRMMPLRQAFARPVTNRQFLMRMINNLKAITISEQDYQRGLQLQESLVRLNPDSPEEKRDRGVLYARNGQNGLAIVDLQTYLAQQPAGRDVNLVRRQLIACFNLLVKQN